MAGSSPTQADQDWAANTKTRGPVVRHQPEDDQEAFGAAQYTKARAVREHYQARLAKIEYEEKVASLVSKDEVKIAQFNIDRQRRDAMLNHRGSRVRGHRGGDQGHADRGGPAARARGQDGHGARARDPERRDPQGAE